MADKTSSWLPDLDKVTKPDGSLPLTTINDIAKRAEIHLIDRKPFSEEDRATIEGLLKHDLHREHPAFRKPLEKALNFVNQGLGTSEAKARVAPKPVSDNSRQQPADKWGEAKPIEISVNGDLRTKMLFTDRFVQQLGKYGVNGLPPQDVQKVEALYQEFMPEIYERQVGSPGANVTRDKLDGQFGRFENQQLLELRRRISEDLHRVGAGKKPRYGNGSPRAEDAGKINTAEEDLAGRRAHQKAGAGEGASEKPAVSEREQNEPNQDGDTQIFAAKPPPVIKAEPLPPADGQTKAPAQPPPPAVPQKSTGRMAVTESGKEVYEFTHGDGRPSEITREIQKALVEAGYDVGVYSEGHPMAGEPMTDGWQGHRTRAAQIDSIQDIMGIEDRACAEDILRRMPIEEYKQLVIDQGLKPDYDADRATHYAQEAAKIKGAAKEEFEDAHGNPAPKSAPDTDPTPPPSTDPVVRMA